MIRIQPKSRHALEPLLEKNPKFELRQVDTDAAMDADIERHVTLGSIWTKKIRLGKCLRIIVDCCNHENELIAFADFGAMEDHVRSEEHTSELQSLMRISYAVFCLKKKSRTPNITTIY